MNRSGSTRAVAAPRGDGTERAAAAGATPSGELPATLELPLRERRLATMALMLASGMQAADATIVNVALPQLERDLGGGLMVGAWVVTGYLCATAIVAPLTGWLRRRFTTATLFTAAVGAFAAASLLCALAPSSVAIIVLRVLQGAAGGAIHPLAQAILLDLYPRRQHGRMLAAWGATLMVGPIAAPAVAGIITDLASWRFVFALNLPLSALAVWAMHRALPRTSPDPALRLDLVGVALLTIAIGALQLTLARGVGQSWFESPELLLGSLVAVAAFAALVGRTRRSASEVFRPAVFTDINFAVASFYNFFVSGLLFVALVFVPALCQGPLAYSATIAGVALISRGVATMAMMLAVGQLVERIDNRILLAIGLALVAGGLGMLAAAEPPNALLWIILGSTMQALGGGMLITCLSTVGFSTLAPELRTDAAGVYSLLRQLGCASGVALMTAVLHAQLDANLTAMNNRLEIPGGSAPPHFLDIAGLQAYSTSFEAMAVAALITLPGVLLFRVRRVPRFGERTAPG